MGWNFNGQLTTIQFSQDNCDNLLTIIRKSLKHKYTPFKQFQLLAEHIYHGWMGLLGGAPPPFK